MNNTFALLQARLRSSRLPGKVLMALQGKSILEISLERLKHAHTLDGIIVVTSNAKENEAINYISRKHKIPCFAGSENDVLDRYYQAARMFDVKHVVRLTADCPLNDAAVVDSVVRLHHRHNADITKSTGFPDGIGACVFSFEALKLAWENASLSSEREHVVPWIMKRALLDGESFHNKIICPDTHNFEALIPRLDASSQTTFKAMEYSSEKNLQNERWTIDEPEDFIFLHELVKVMPVPLEDASWLDVLNTLDKYPDIKLINNSIPRNEGYSKSLAEDHTCL